MPDRKFRVFLVDDHPVVRLWLGHLIEEQGDLFVCGEADSVGDALQRIPGARPDLAILDISLPGASGMELIESLKSRHPDLLMIVLSMYDENVYAEPAIRAGARGFVMKQVAANNMIEAIYNVLRGKLAVSDPVAALLSEKFEGRTNSST